MNYSLRQSLMAGASALVFTMGVSVAQAGVTQFGANAFINANSVTNNSSQDNGDTRRNDITNSHNPGAGIVHEQQNNGNNNSINAATAVTANMQGNVNISNGAFVNSFTAENDTVTNLGNRRNDILNSFNGFDGELTVQQNNGDHNEIGAATAIYGSTVGLGDITQNADARTDTEFQTSNDGRLRDNGSTRNNLINPSFNNSNGVATIQQNNGNANALAAATAVTTADNSADDIDQTVTAVADSDDNNVLDEESRRDNQIGRTGGGAATGAFNNADGIVTVQQNNGDANAISAATGVVGIGVNPGDSNVDEINQDVTASDNDLDRVNTDDRGLSRRNAITESFNLADGVVTVQQNNGNANQMSAATGVVGVTNDVTVDDIDQNVLARFNDVGDFGSVSADDAGGPRTNDVTNSFNGSTGVITVQQNNGDANTMNAATGVVGILDDVTGSDDVNQVVEASDSRISEEFNVSTNTAREGDVRTNTIDPSFQRAAGVVTVQQNNGDANSINAATGVVGVGADGDNQTGNLGDDLNQRALTEDNEVEFPFVTDRGGRRTNTVLNSFDDFSGTATVQQNNGNANSINAATAIAGVENNVGGNISQDTDDDVEAEDNEVKVNARVPRAARRANNITDSFDRVTGNVIVQQNNGDANSMNAATAVVGVGGNVSGDVTQEPNSEGNDLDDSNIDDLGSNRNNSITGSFNPAAGVSVVQQNNGTGNSVNAATAVVGVDGNIGGDLLQGALPNNEVDTDDNDIDNITVDTSNDATRRNTISSSFRTAAGVHTVQQNNGDANTLNTAVAVAMVGGSTGDVSQVVDANDNTVTNVQGTDLDGESDRDNAIQNSFISTSGIATVQQNNGGANTVNAAVAVAFVGGEVDEVTQDLDTSGSVSNVVTNSVIQGATTTGGDRDNLINPSFNMSAGVVTAQQNNGDANVMEASTAVLVADGGVDDGDDVTQNVVNSGTVSLLTEFEDDNGNPRNNRIATSFDDASGTMTVQQNNGDANVIQAATAYLLIDGGNSGDESSQTVAVSGGLSRNFNTDDDEIGRRDNSVDSSFNDASGVATVQQNNGTGNVVSSATAVMVDRGTSTNAGADDVNVQSVSTRGTIVLVTSDRDNVNTRPTDRSNLVDNSFGGEDAGPTFAGIATAQQNNGDNSVVLSSTSVRANDGSADDLDAVNSATASTSGFIRSSAYNNANNPGNDGDPTNTISRSFTGAAGITTAQQNSGNNNIIGAAVGVLANNMAGGTPSGEPVTSSAMGSAQVIGNVARLGPEGRYTNSVSSSFGGASVVATVQQNNGHNNVVGAATQVTASDDSDFGPAMSVAALSATVSGNEATQVPPGSPTNRYRNEIAGSFNNGASGVSTVQQNNGSNNVVGSAISIVSNN